MYELEKRIYVKRKSRIKKIISKTMNKNKKYWFSYYNNSKKNNEYLKFNSYLDRIRYYWSHKDIIKSKNILFKNLNNINATEFALINKYNKENIKIKNKLKLNNVEFILFKFLENTLIKYYSACGFKIK